MSPGVAKAHMQAPDAMGAPSIRPHTLDPLPTQCYLVCLENLDTGVNATDYVKNLTKWYARFLLLPVFDGIDTVSDPVFIELTRPVGVFSITSWKKQGVSFRTSVTYASDDDASSNTDQVNVYVRSPPMQASYTAVTKNCPTTAGRIRAQIQQACCRIVAQQGFRRLPALAAAPADASLDALMDQMCLSHGASITTANNADRVAFGGQFETNSREETVGSTILPMVLRQLFCLKEVLDDSTCTPYCICAVNPFAYAILLPNIGGWTICIQVNLLARIDAVLQLFSQQRVNYVDMVQSRLNTPAIRQADISALKAYERELVDTTDKLKIDFTRLAGRGLDITTLSDAAAQLLPANQFPLYMAHVGLTLLSERARRKRKVAISTQNRRDAQYTARELLTHNSTSSITTDMDMRVKIVRSALGLLEGNVKRWIRAYVNTTAYTKKQQFMTLVLTPASLSDDSWPAVDKTLYDCLTNSLGKMEPAKWSHHLVKLMETDANTERDLVRLLFFSDEVFPYLPSHIRCSLIRI